MSTDLYRVDQAVIPAAGLGTRLSPITKVIPKEMLPIGRMPVLEHIVVELIAIGIKHIIFVISPEKTMIRDYFGHGSQLGITCEYVMQVEKRGAGEGILRCRPLLDERSFVVALGDCIIQKDPMITPLPLARSIETLGTKKASAAGLVAYMDRAGTYGRYTILANATNDDALKGRSFELPKPELHSKPSEDTKEGIVAVAAARWVLTPTIFDYLANCVTKRTGEIQLTDAIQLLQRDYAVWAVPLVGREERIDIGIWSSYLQTAAKAAVNDPECGRAVLAAIG